MEEKEGKLPRKLKKTQVHIMQHIPTPHPMMNSTFANFKTSYQNQQSEMSSAGMMCGHDCKFLQKGTQTT